MKLEIKKFATQMHMNAQSFFLSVVVLGFSTSGSSVNAASLKAEDLFRSDHLYEVEIKMADEDWKKLRSESDRSNSGMGFMFGGAAPTDRFTQFKADIKVDGTQIKEVGIRTKGFIGSLNSDRPSFKIKFDEYIDQSPIDGLDRLTLNNNVQDESLASQYLTYKLFNQAGIPAPRVSFTKVTVNGEYLGIYSHVESVRSPFLKRHFQDDSGEFYEGTIADFFPKALDRLEAKNKRTEKDKSQAMQLAQLLETEEGFDLGKAEKLVNVDTFIRFWVMESLLGFWDGYSNNQNNYFAYSNPSDHGRFHFMPWGADGAFAKGGGPFRRFSGADAPVSIYGQGMLANRLYHAEGIPERYKTTMEDILKNIWNEEAIIADLERIHKMAQGHLHRRQDRVRESKMDVSDFVLGRRSEIESELSKWPVEIGEIRLPQHTVDVGKLKGTFTTVWKNERLQTAMDQGEINIQLQLEDKMISFSKKGIIAQPEQPRGSFRFGREARGGPAPEPKSTLTFEGNRNIDGDFVSIILTIENENFTRSDDKGTPFQGILMITDSDQQNNGGRFPFGGMQNTLTGLLHFDEASLVDGAPVTGRMDMDIKESRGGMFGGPRRGGRGPGGPPFQRGGRPRGDF